jgi:hypothetical protein
LLKVHLHQSYSLFDDGRILIREAQKCTDQQHWFLGKPANLSES